jgi:hypothetical protein
MLGLPRVSPPAHPHHQRPRTSQSGDKAPQQGGEDLPQQGACLQLVTALAVKFSEVWVTSRRYLDMRELEEYRSEQRGAEEAVLMKR